MIGKKKINPAQLPAQKPGECSPGAMAGAQLGQGQGRGSPLQLCAGRHTPGQGSPGTQESARFSSRVCNGHKQGLGSEMNYNPSCVSFVIDAYNGPRAGGMCCGAGGSTAGSHTQHPPSGGALGAWGVDVRDTNVRATRAVSLVRAKHLQVRVFLP